MVLVHTLICADSSLEISVLLEVFLDEITLSQDKFTVVHVLLALCGKNCFQTVFLEDYHFAVKCYVTVHYYPFDTLTLLPSLGGEGQKPSVSATLFSVFLTIQGKLLHRGYTIAIILALPIMHAPHQHSWLSLGPAPDSKCSKTVEVRC